ncbi:MAG: hypothetical protein IPN74_07190 [Haliscomenobacter sp.]|nr:hypothetical protein [Haliscomenobacter sp.]
MIAYSPNAGKVIHPHFSVYGGSGRFDLVNSDRERIFAFQPAAGLELNVFRWFRLGLEGGYRFITDVDTQGVSSSELYSVCPTSVPLWLFLVGLDIGKIRLLQNYICSLKSSDFVRNYPPVP